MKKQSISYMIFAILLCLCLSGCAEKKEKTPKPQESFNPHAEITYEKERDYVGVVKGIDTTEKTLTLYNTYYEEEAVCSYGGGTEFMSKNDKQISSESLEIGQVVDVYFDGETQKLKKVQLTKDVIEYEKVKDLLVNTDENYVEVGGVRYRYGSGFTAFSLEQPVDLKEITSLDEVTFRGVKGKAYSIIVTKGHGYLKPEKYKDFVGGTMTIHGEMILPVTEKMLIPVPEGSYDVSMKNGDFVGSRAVTVERDQQTTLDMSKFKSLVANRGQVRFDIQPVGAELYLNGTLTDYGKPVSLAYGKHSIKVVLDGYTTYTGVIDVQSTSPTIRIDLAEEEAEVEDEKENTSVSDEEAAGEDTSGQYDNEHTITVSAPEGASVYLDGTYKGVAPCSFSKKIGSVTITLSQTGYTTKSYAMTTTDDGEDVKFAFPALISTAVG